MLTGDLNILFSFFFIIFFSIILNTNTALHLLLTAEILWVTLYSITLFIGIFSDNLNLLSLTFFFLIFSAVELGIGLVILLFQNIINRSVNLNDGESNYMKFSTRFKNKLYVNKLNWKI